jgi:hypothetical protein
LIVDGSATFGNQIYQSTEHISVAGGSSGNPNASFVYTFVTTTGSGTATGTLANGLVESQRKILIAESLAVPYQLTITNVVDPALGLKSTETVYLISAGDRIELVWNATAGAWFVDYQSVPDTLNVYVSASGSDSANNGLSSASPVATLQRAINIAHRIGWRSTAYLNVIGTVNVPSNINFPFSAKGDTYPQRSFVVLGNNINLIDTMTITAINPVGTSGITGRITITASGSSSFATGALNGHLMKFTSGTFANFEIVILDHVALGGGSHLFRVGGNFETLVVGDTFQVHQLTSVLNLTGTEVRFLAGTTIEFRYVRFVVSNTLRFALGSDYFLNYTAILPSTSGSGAITIDCFSNSIQNSTASGPAICGNTTRNVILNVNPGCTFSNFGFSASYTHILAFYSGMISINSAYLYNTLVYADSTFARMAATTVEANLSTFQIFGPTTRDNVKGLITIQGGSLNTARCVIVGATGMEASRQGILVLGGTASILNPYEIAGVSGNGIYVSGGQVNINTDNASNIVINNCLGSGVLVRHSGRLNVHDKNTTGLRGTGNNRYGVESTGGSVMVAFPATGTTISGSLGEFFDGTSLITWAQVIPGNLIHSSTGAINIGGYIELWRTLPPSQAFGNITADGLRGVLTFTTTLAAGSSATATVFNTYVFSSSTVLVNLVEYTGTPFTNGLPRIWVSNVSNGQFTLVLINEHSTNALNGTIKVGFLVVGKFS